MIWIIIGLYLIPFLYTFRWTLGWATSGQIDDYEELVFCSLLSIGAGAVWPAIWAYRWSYKGWVRFGPEEKDPLVHISRMFPEPKPLETKQQRNERLKREKEAEEERLTYAR